MHAILMKNFLDYMKADWEQPGNLDYYNSDYDPHEMISYYLGEYYTVNGQLILDPANTRHHYLHNYNFTYNDYEDGYDSWG